MSGRSAPHPNQRAKDDIIYEPDAIAVGLLLFPGRACSECGRELPENADYFTPNNIRRRSDGVFFKSVCWQCRRAIERRRHAAKVAAR